MKIGSHKVWKIWIASRDDARILKSAGKRALIPDLPTLKTYYIEGNSMIRAEKKALKMAIEEGINDPISKGSLWANCPGAGEDWDND